MDNWIPGGLVRRENEWLCRWLDTGDIPFTDPFFQDTLNKCRYLPVNAGRYMCTGSLHSMIEWAADLPSVPPAAFIFHVSRCGSTLLSQLLGLDPAHIVLSEVPFIDELLRLPHKYPGDPNWPDLEMTLKAAIGFYGQQRTGEEKRLFIKADSWHILFYEQLRKWYPTTPFVLLYRSPDQVLYSHRRKRGMHAVPGVIEPSVFGLEKIASGPGDAPDILDAHLAGVLQRYLSQFLQIIHTDQHALLVNYNEGMSVVVEKIAALTGTPLSEALREQMATRIRFHAKYPKQIFSEEAQTQEPPSFMEPAMELYRLLELERCQVSQNKPA